MTYSLMIAQSLRVAARLRFLSQPSPISLPAESDQKRDDTIALRAWGLCPTSSWENKIRTDTEVLIRSPHNAASGEDVGQIKCDRGVRGEDG